MSSNAFSVKDDEYLDWHHRPEVVSRAIEYSFRHIELSTRSSWNLHNGKHSYYHLNISQLKLAKKIIEDAHKEGRKDVYILDSGAGDFQSCDAFAEYLNDHRFVLPQGMTFHIIGTRGEHYEGKAIEQIGPCKVYKFGSFKIEEHQEELRKRGLDLKDKIDLTISNWAHRHYVDSLGTWGQLFQTTRPKTGLILMDWCYYLYEGETFENKVDAFHKSRDHLLDLLLHINAPFLFQPHGDGFNRETDRFILRRENDTPLKLPLAYKEVQGCDGRHFDIGSHHVVVFKVLDPPFKADKRKKHFVESLSENGGWSNDSLWGDLALFQWLTTNDLMDDFFYSFQQLFQIKKDQEEVIPLYSSEEVVKRKEERLEKNNQTARLEKDIQGKKKQFFSSLKFYLPREIEPVAVGIANGARKIERSLFQTLRQGNFEEAQSLVDKGADVNRVFDYSPFNKTLLDFAISTADFPKGTIPFLLKNRAKTQDACLDNALYFYKTFEEVQLLIQHGIEIKDVNLALYRSISRGELDLIDLFISKGGNVNAFINGLPMIYGASYNNKTWNYLIERGAKGTWGNELSKRPIESAISPENLTQKSPHDL